MIELHSSPTPNGQKVMIMLEETGLEWKHFDVYIRLGEQFSPNYLKLSPNNKIPAIVDTEGPGGGPYTMMESGAILFYLAEKTRKFLPKAARKRYDTIQWLMFQMAHVGPMFGQANHFNNYAKENIQYGKDRYNNESVRLYRVLDNRFATTHGSPATNTPSRTWRRTHGPRGTRTAGSTKPAIPISCAGSRPWRRGRQCSETIRWRPISGRA